MKNLLVFCLVFATGLAYADNDTGARAFNQLGTNLPTPNVYRSASGAPGPQYWQQQVDYDIDVTLDEAAKRISATETITYRNNSPDTLRYLWVQLDQNRFRNDSIYRRTYTTTEDRVSFGNLRREQHYADVDYGYDISRVATPRGEPIDHVINGTMMRVDLPAPLEPGEQTRFVIDFAFNITNEKAVYSRGGYEHFPESDTYTYFLAQWFPRLAAYSDYAGWHNKQFLGDGEFALEFGDYDVAITVPADHIVSATGELENPRDVMTAEQRDRLANAGTESPVFIVTPEEALDNEQEGTDETRTWRFKAENVRDFAWSSSRKYIWDAMIFEQPGAEHERVLSMSFYPNEAEPIWSQYSTHAVVHTMEVYNRFAFDYPYPTAQSVNVWESGGMEYPMISFNGYRPDPPGDDENGEEVGESSSRTFSTSTNRRDETPTYSRRTKYGLIAVIIHEIGHIYFPMVVNSDEREWTWMDEGINSFLEYVATMEWEEDYPAYGGRYANVLDYITEYMTSPNQVPIMTHSDSVVQFGPNAYSKPAAALIVLRETVMGRELFDFAFRQYSERWRFKRPTPADFFRTMEDASAVDLDWFWRGWFYTTDHVDVAITDMRQYRLLSQDPDIDNPRLREDWKRNHPPPIGEARNRDEGIELRLDQYPDQLTDFYNENDRFTVSNKDRNTYQSFIDDLEDWQRAAYDRAMAEDPYIYFVDFENVGGLVTPLPLAITYADGSSKEMMIPAEIWRHNAENITRVFIEDKPIAAISVDDKHQIADADYGNNRFPPRIERSRFEIYKYEQNRRNLMKDMMVELKGHDQETDETDSVPLQQQ